MKQENEDYLLEPVCLPRDKAAKVSPESRSTPATPTPTTPESKLPSKVLLSNVELLKLQKTQHFQ